MKENDIIQLIDSLRGQLKDSAVLLVVRRGEEITIANAGAHAALTASVSFNEDTRAARNALVNALLQILMCRQSDNDLS